jgi:hypothetical protein
MTLEGRRRFRRDDVLHLVERLANFTTLRAPAERRRHC